MNFRRLFHITFLALAIGCGSRSSEPDLIPVSGQVTLKDGSPLPGAIVTFLPEGSTPGIAFSGRTDKEGRYSLRSPRGNGGASEGEYKVTISKLVMPDGSDFDPNAGIGEDDSPAQQKLSDYYANPDKTTLRKTVKRDGGEINFVLKVGKNWK